MSFEWYSDENLRGKNNAETGHSRSVAGYGLLLYPSCCAAPQVEPPPLVRLTGALQPLAEKSHSSLHTLTVSIQGQERLFRITKVEKLTGRSPDGWRLLQSLFPPQVRLVGAEGLLRMLQAPELEGIPLIIEGRLYVRDRMLLVTVVEEASKERQPPKPAGVL